MSDWKRKRPEWEEYCVGEPSTRSDWINVNCCPFETVYHVAHVFDAFRIFEDRRLRATLVKDEDKLNKTRSSVTWLSPNTWSNGSHFGNIGFAFDWKELMQGKKFYWIGGMPYRTKTFRILVTDDEPTVDLKQYRPEKDNGPLYHDTASGTWYWNGETAGQFMFDGDLWLEECKAVSFVNHKDDSCKKNGRSCSDMGLQGHQAGAALLSRLIAQNVIHGKGSLRRLFLKGGKLHRDAEAAWGNILRAFNRVETVGKLTRKDEAASPLVTAMLDRYGTKRKIKQLGSLFRSTEELELALRIRVAKAFDIPVENVTDSGGD
ncbi:MAG TPA: hypothetical protein VKY85_12290 [Candidatus Angelobacter sp.]|nr:hypothetical protein [Candidatus Angelobacter sp.]